LVNFLSIWCILWHFGIYLWSFSPFWYIVPRKIWQPCSALVVENPTCGKNFLKNDFVYYMTFNFSVRSTIHVSYRELHR
jgi:hypothetical protein